MGRHERPVPDGVLHDFASDLRALRAAAGNPTYRELSERAKYSRSALSAAAGGEVLPTLQVTLAYVQACGGDVDTWRSRWNQAASSGSAASPVQAPNGPGPAAPQPRPGLVTALARRRTPIAVVAGAVTLICATAIVTAVVLGSPAPTRYPVAALSRTGSTPAPAPAATPTTSATPATSAAPSARSAPSQSAHSYDQTTGPGCPDVATATTGRDDSSPTHQWTTATAARWTVAGCANVLLYSTPTTEANPNRWQDDYAWSFDRVPTTAACTFHIYIPASPYAAYTAAYDWTPGTPNYLEGDAFTIDQATHRGTWYEKGPFTFNTGKAMLMITDARTGAPSATLTAAATRLTCT